MYLRGKNRIKRNREKRVPAAVNVRPKINYTLGPNGRYILILSHWNDKINYGWYT